MRKHRGRGPAWGKLALILVGAAALVAAYTPAAFVLLPRPLLTLVSVMTFGVLFGLAYSTTGVLIAALVTYYAGCTVPKKTLKRLAGDALEPAGKLLREHGVIAVFGSNMVPTPPFVVQNMIAGAVRIPLWKFMLGTFLALLPGMLAGAHRRRARPAGRLHLHRPADVDETLSVSLVLSVRNDTRPI